MSFDPDGADFEGYGQRLTRAHANCHKNIPLFIGMMLLAIVSGHSDITDAKAYWLSFARIAKVWRICYRRQHL